MFCTFTLALPAVCVQCPIWLFSVIPQFRTFLLRCSDICLSDFEKFSVAPIISGILLLLLLLFYCTDFQYKICRAYPIVFSPQEYNVMHNGFEPLMVQIHIGF